MADKDTNREVTFDITEHIGVLSESTKGWKKELNLVAWNGGNSKYDIRDWAEGHEKMSRGITLNKDEVKALSDLLNGIGFSNPN